MASQEIHEAKKAFERPIQLANILTNTFGMWPYDIKSKAEIITFKDKFLWVNIFLIAKQTENYF